MNTQNSYSSNTMQSAFLALVLTILAVQPTICDGQEPTAPTKEPMAKAEPLEAKEVAEQFSSWMPPASPEPGEILDEAEHDARRGRYADALAKQVWFHEHALEIDEGYYGVRLSFALSSWNELGKKYPPARKKLIEVRDAAKAIVLSSKDARDAFHDLQSINETLEQQAQTVEVFKVLRKQTPAFAKDVYDIAQSDLIRAKEYKLCGEYLNPKADFRLQRLRYEADLKFAEDPQFGEEHLEYARESFMYGTTTLVALLVVNDRKVEAKEVAKQAIEVWDSPKLRTALDEALEGEVPPPWP